TPDDVRAEWASHGVPAFASEQFGASLDAVCERLGVNQEHNDPSLREQKLRDACIELGWHIDAMPRNVTKACDQGKECGYGGFGCRRGAKQSTVKTWLRDAHEVGARIVVGANVERVTVVDGAARGGPGTPGPGPPLARPRGGGPRPRRARPRRRGPPPDGPLARRRRGLRRAPHAGAAEALRPAEP